MFEGQISLGFFFGSNTKLIKYAQLLYTTANSDIIFPFNGKFTVPSAKLTKSQYFYKVYLQKHCQNVFRGHIEQLFAVCFVQRFA